ncbi:hypothetical protein [Leptolyngbya iicbica]|uniref:Uncharacterized protein n=1 Tax=Lyngbya confervoides BDU141951 TaxID=1574623 RepID=A0A8T6QWL2_9CYAN|nr:hypothetical protein [Leptolyngbya sp. LK]
MADTALPNDENPDHPNAEAPGPFVMTSGFRVFQQGPGAWSDQLGLFSGP